MNTGNQIVNRKGPIIDPGLCRCCGVSKKCRLLNVEYEWCGQKEIYSDMFFDCFGLLLSQLDGEPEDRLICATCVTRLREATAFRKQVLDCEQKLLQTTMNMDFADSDKNGLKNESEVKKEIQDDAGLIPESDVGEEYADYMDDGVEREKSEIKVKKTIKRKKKMKLMETSKKKSKRKSSINAECHKIQRKLNKTITDINNELLYKGTEVESQQPVLDTEDKSFLNTATLVENSYVCPFDSQFSDYICIYCRQVFVQPDELREHTLTHSPDTYKDIVATYKKLLQLDLYRLDCRLCPKSLNNVQSLKEHLTLDHGKIFHDTLTDFLGFRLTFKNLSCTECGAGFNFFHALKKHMAEHFGTCICDVCGAHYFEERMLVVHQKTHQKVERSFPCHCGKIFKSKQGRYLHEAKIHKKEPVYQCSKCEGEFFSYSLRSKHMMEAHGDRRSFPCERCDRAYVSRKSLREHTRRFHLKVLKHQCEVCDKRFYLPSRLKEHMATHTGERNYRCEYCGKSYPRLRGLNVHMQSHSADKRYGCPVCSASFTQNVNLRNHMRRQHQSLEVDYQEQ